MSNARILVVDDEPAIVNTVQAYLEQEGYTVYTAMDGPAALKAARAFRPDLIVLDIMLLEMDGFEVLRRLRQESDVYVSQQHPKRHGGIGGRRVAGRDLYLPGRPAWP